MSYYDSVQNRQDYASHAPSVQQVSLDVLQQENSWEDSASNWRTWHLTACRVLCRKPNNVLSVLSSQVRTATGINPCIDQLINGPNETKAILKGMAEPQIVQAYGFAGLGYIWAALVPLFRSEQSGLRTLASDRPRRETIPIETAGYVSSQDMQISSSPIDRPSTASSAPSSLGYVDKSWAPLVEDHTVRFIGCITRCILNYAQPTNKVLPYVEYRDHRLSYHAVRGERKSFMAIDDGGIQYRHRGFDYQVAIIEAKGDFQKVVDGVPILTDDLLAQVVGEALALRISETRRLYQDGVIAIIAIKHYVKILHLRITDIYLRHFRFIRPNDQIDNPDTFMPIESTIWYDLSQQSGRKIYVQHIVALITQADTVGGSR